MGTDVWCADVAEVVYALYTNKIFPAGKFYHSIVHI